MQIKPDQDADQDNGLQKQIESAVCCQNCSTVLLGPFCHQCGQPQRGPIREFFAIITDGSAQLLRFDGKLMQSLAMLFLRPGALINRYLAGQRVQFVKPIKLYLGLSLLLFLLMGLANAIDSLQEIETVQPKTTPLLQVGDDGVDAVFTIGPNGVGFTYAGKPWHAAHNPIAAKALPSWVNRWINRKLSEVDSASKQVHQDPRKLFAKVLAVLPTTMFVLVPIFALLLKCLYFFSKRLYAEHLLVAVQAHSFIFLCLIIALLLRVLAVLAPALNAVALIGYVCLAIWTVVYLFLQQKRVYAQHFVLTLLMYGLAGFAYFVMLVIAVSFTLVGALANY
jgi:hypothetical protein